MPPQKLIEYIKEARNQGKADEEIKKSLLDNGWPEDDVGVALNQLSNSKQENNKTSFLEKIQKALITTPPELALIVFFIVLLNITSRFDTLIPTTVSLFLIILLGWHATKDKPKSGGLLMIASGVLGLFILGFHSRIDIYLFRLFDDETLILASVLFLLLVLVGCIYFFNNRKVLIEKTANLLPNIFKNINFILKNKFKNIAKNQKTSLFTLVIVIFMILLRSVQFLEMNFSSLNFLFLALFSVILIGWDIAKDNPKNGSLLILLSSALGFLVSGLSILLIENQAVDLSLQIASPVLYLLLIILGWVYFKKRNEFSDWKSVLNIRRIIEISLSVFAYVGLTRLLPIILVALVYVRAIPLTVIYLGMLSAFLFAVYLTMLNLSRSIGKRVAQMRFFGALILILSIMMYFFTQELSFSILTVGFIYIANSFITPYKN